MSIALKLDCLARDSALLDGVLLQLTCALYLLVDAWLLPAVLHQPMPFVPVGLHSSAADMHSYLFANL